MPQAMAMQLPTIAATAPTATPASTQNVAGKVPMFAGVLSQLDRNGAPTAPKLLAGGGGAVAGAVIASGDVEGQQALPLPSAAPFANRTALTLGGTMTPTDTAISNATTSLNRATTPNAATASDSAGTLNDLTTLTTAITPNAATPLNQPATLNAATSPNATTAPRAASDAAALAFVRSGLPATAPSGNTASCARLAGAGHSGVSPDAAAAAASDPAAAAAAMAIPATLSPTDPQSQPSLEIQAQTSQPGGSKLEGVAAKPGPPRAGPPQSATGPEALASASAAASASAGLASSSAPVPIDTSAATTMGGAAPPQSILAAAQQAQSAGLAQLAVPIESASAAPPGAASAVSPDATAAAPAQQVSAALVSLAGAPGGGQRMTLRLEPAELGQVQIRIDRPTDAPAQVDISVQRPETLTLLLRDQPQLQRALDQAGVPADGRSLTLHVTTPEPGATAGSVHSSPGASADLGQSHGNGSGGRFASQGIAAGRSDPDQDDSAMPLPRWLRAGLDITA